MGGLRNWPQSSALSADLRSSLVVVAQQQVRRGRPSILRRHELFNGPVGLRDLGPPLHGRHRPTMGIATSMVSRLNAQAMRQVREAIEDIGSSRAP